MTRSLALVVLGAFGAAMAVLLFAFHRIPLYGVETDLFGEYIPAARSLLAGAPTATQYEFKGPGYPALLAGFTVLSFGDAWFAARLLNLVAALAGAWVTFLLARRTLGDVPAVFVLAALCASPLYVRTTLEAGTDVPTFALSIASILLVLGARDERRAALSGALAGAAILCRYNAAFLVPAALATLALAPAPDRTKPWWRLALAWLLGVALPLAPWLVLNQRMTGDALANRNYVNLAFELYGDTVPWDRFWAEVAPRFDSFADVLLYDPGRALAHWGRNLATRWLTDLRQLVPVWMGAAAALGALLHVRRAGRGAGLLVPFVLAYATLALVFYTPRFFLVLVPFYLLAAALAFFPRVGARTAPWRRALPVAAGLAVAASAVFAGRELVALLKDTPVEVVEAGRVLRAGARPGDKLVARKPQVAYFAGMKFVPIPQVETLRELLASARDAGATHLNLSGIELSLRPQFRLLGETDVALPGYTRIARDLSDAEHPFILYRIEPASPADSAFGDSLAVALLDLAARFPLSVEAQAYVGALLLDEGRTADALACLDRAVAIDPRAVQPRAFRAPALYEAGRLDEAARDCEFVIAALARPPAAFHLLLGAVRVQEGRWEEARASFASAAAGEPAHLHARLALATALLALGRDDEARAELAQAERLEPAAAAIGAVALGFAARGDRVGLARLAVRILGGFGTMEAILGLDGPATVAGRANPR